MVFQQFHRNEMTRFVNEEYGDQNEDFLPFRGNDSGTEEDNDCNNADWWELRALPI